MPGMHKLFWLGALLGLSASALGAAGDWSGQVIYQVMPDRFFDGDPSNNAGVDRNDPGAWHGGDLKGLTSKLSYIRDLGATSLWLTPVYQQPPGRTGNATGYHGYWPWDFQQVDPHYGTLGDFKTLVGAAHAAKLRVVLDQVINHYGYGAPAQAQHPDWFHAPETCKAKGDDIIYCPLAGLPDLAQENPAVRQFLFANADFWRATGVDAFRYDAIKRVDKSFLADLVNRDATAGTFTIGEVLDPDSGTLATYQQLGVASVFDFAMQDALKQSVMGGQSLTRIAAVLARDTEFKDTGLLATILDNHDLPRFANGSPFEDEGRARTVYGLRALMTLRGIPTLWQGTEIAMRGGADPDNRRDMRFPEQWTPEERATFEATKQAIGVRKAHPALWRGSTKLLSVPDSLADDLLVFMRQDSGGERVLVAMHNGRARKTYGLGSTLGDSPELGDMFGQDAKFSAKGKHLYLSLPPRTAVAFQLK